MLDMLMLAPGAAADVADVAVTAVLGTVNTAVTPVIGVAVTTVLVATAAAAAAADSTSVSDSPPLLHCVTPCCAHHTARIASYRAHVTTSHRM